MRSCGRSGARAASLSFLAALVVGVLAGDELFGEMQRDFGLGLLPRQATLQEGPADLQIFTGDLGGAAAPAITKSADESHPYSIDGEDVSSFNDAINKACDKQLNDCSDLANGAMKGQFEVNDCNDQKEQCRSTLSAATQTAFLSIATSNAEFDFFCEN
ncbi:hypothetical protein F4775DRAFT_145793 [Biscogniauxia sp. FL1348]|nr:hypothetical protein F4775DRAFT_145793 [Biscogniauxia sp. FL1348]